MKARIIQIGNSRGIRIPKSLLEQSHLTGEFLLVHCYLGGTYTINVSITEPA